MFDVVAYGSIVVERTTARAITTKEIAANSANDPGSNCPVKFADNAATWKSYALRRLLSRRIKILLSISTNPTEQPLWRARRPTGAKRMHRPAGATKRGAGADTRTDIVNISSMDDTARHAAGAAEIYHGTWPAGAAGHGQSVG